MPPESPTITGRPHAAASRKTFPSPRSRGRRPAFGTASRRRRRGVVAGRSSSVTSPANLTEPVGARSARPRSRRSSGPSPRSAAPPPGSAGIERIARISTSLALPRDQPAHADDHRSVAQVVSSPEIVGGQIRTEPLDVGAGMQHRAGRGRGRRSDAARDELAAPGHARRHRRHPRHHRVRDRDGGHPVVEPVREHEVGAAGGCEPRTEQGQREGVSEEDHLGSVGPRTRHAVGERGGRPEERRATRG